MVPRLAGEGPVPRIHDTATDTIAEARPVTVADRTIANLYVCGITPYDATHIGHAATYLAYDTLIRLWLDAGFEVAYVQNATDVDDPLLERAAATGVDWRDLAASQLDRFRADMEALGVIPPDNYVAVTEFIQPIAQSVQRLLELGLAYRLDDDVYFDGVAAAAASPWQLGDESRLDRATMLELSAQRGGDPDRPGKRDALDPVLWRAPRDGEPRWETAVGAGRPGWHIECSVIAQEFLDLPLSVNGGGIDLAFPHHEFTAAHTAALTGISHARLYSHAALVSYRGEKMSKSLGNLVFVSELLAAGADPRAIRLAILAQHYRSGWEWTDATLASATARLARWDAWAAAPGDGSGLADALRGALADDLDTPRALALVDAAGAPDAADLAAVHALLGIALPR
ncbi:cysteine--1-D-myo-inosityl 2-amino-2-deoxy-alpha-D-glucopyranoside ligase [soil metagenome]